MSDVRVPTADEFGPAIDVAQPKEATRLRDLSPQQWKSGIAAWLGWMFDGLDMHLYTLVATPFVAILLALDEKHRDVRDCSAWIQAAFLFGWALGGGFFGRIGDRLGRSRALMLTIMTYALFTGLSCLAQTWWQLFIFRFLAALGIGGEWSVGASLLSETWPKRWRPWLAAVLQTGVNCGVLLACLAGLAFAAVPPRYIFLVGILPALLVLWIRRAVPETEEWHAARLQSGQQTPKIADLFRGAVRRTTILTLLVCAFSLTAHWAFTFWSLQHLGHLLKQDQWTDEGVQQLKSWTFFGIMVAAIAGNFLAGAIAYRIGYRNSIALLCLAYFVVMFSTYCVDRSYQSLLWWLPLMGACQGIFALFTMYMPPLFPTLLRTTGAGFCYNIGRIAAGLGTVLFGIFGVEGVYRLPLLYASFLFLPAAAIALTMPELPIQKTILEPVE
jgi:MFS family permease